MKGKNRLISTILCVCMFVAPVVFSAGHFSVKAAAEQSTVKDNLLLPSSYQQYLPLEAPTDVAASEKYTAIADGNAIYFYNVAQNEYVKYQHAQNADETKNVVTKLQFADDGLLYFLDSSTFLYAINPATLEVEKTQLVCSTFTIYGNEIFFTNVSASSQLSKTTLDKLDVSQSTLLVGGLGSKPVVAQKGGVVYYTNNGSYLHRIQPLGNAEFIKYFTSEIISIAFNGNVFSFTDKNGDFYAYLLSDILNGSNALDVQPLCSASGGYTALSAHGDYIYAVKGNSVRRYDVTINEFTDFEVCDNSNSPARLSGASETLLVENTLYIADCDNQRILLYDAATNSLKNSLSLQTKDVSHLSSDNQTLLVSNGTSAFLYDIDGEDFGTLLAELGNFKGELTGTACVFGNYYLVTNANYFYQAVQTENGWALNGSSKTAARNADLLASDVYGYLYALSGANLYKFTEEEFLRPESDGELITSSIPAGTTKLQLDYQQNVYALCQNKLYKFGAEEKVYPLNKSLVYSQNEQTAVSSFTFGVEENATYLLYDGNFLISTADLSLPTVKTIAVNDADDEIFSETSATVEVVGVKENALVIRFDVNALQGATYFPYLSYHKNERLLTALKLGETDKYALIAVYNKENNDYSTYLVLKQDCAPLSTDEYKTEYPEEQQRTGYVSNDIQLYKFPYLTSLLTVTQLKKDAQVTVLGEINRLDYDYYHVSVQTEEGEVTGYLPKSYVNDIDGEPPEPNPIVIGDEKDESHSVSRLAYLLLGAAAICILFDYLLIRKNKE